MNDTVEMARHELIGFGPFVLDRAAKQLRRDGCPVHLGSRALDLLIMLVTHAGTVVGRAALVAFVWPSTVVEETSLRVHISALRRALGEAADDGPRYIANVPGRGYSFVMPVHALAAGAAAIAASGTGAAATRMPPGPARTFGRADVVKLIGEQLTRKRLLSIVGPGGMGKTTVALAVAEAGIANYPDGVRFVDLAGLVDPAKVPAALALAVGANASQCEPLRALAAFLGARSMLIVLDNCEHVIHAAAALVESVLAAAPGLRIIATSREPLDANGEWVLRLAPLAAPEPASAASAAEALDYPAVQLFVERARAAADGFTLNAANVALVVHLCRRLDGIALAIELAAARVDSLGLPELVARLDDMFQLLTRGRRTVLPRHRTLLALFDWSYALLDADERHVLACLSVFRARFTLEAAVAVALDPNGALTPDVIVDCVLSLAAKSLVAVDAGAACSYRLLFTTRTYAAGRLRDSAAGAAVARRHAHYVLGVFARSSDELNHLFVTQWQARHRHLMDDVRAALDWALAVDGDIVVGVQLVVAAYQAMYGLGELDAYREQVELAIDQLGRLVPPRRELELGARSAWCYLSGQTPLDDDGQALRLNSTLVLAEHIGSPRQRIFALHGVCCSYFGHGEYPLSLEIAQRIRIHTGDADPAAVLLSDRLVALNLHFLGQHRQARALALQVLAHPDVPMPREYVSHTPKGVSIGGMFARIAWIEGDAERAVQLADEAVALALSDGIVAFVVCQALGMAAIPVALWCGDLERAAALTAQLAAVASGGGLRYWESWAHGFARVIALAGQRGGSADWQAPANAKECDLLATFDSALVSAATLARSEAGTVGWCAPEVLRAHGEQLLRAGAPAAQAQAEALFARALALARTQHALAWELRAATSLARLWQADGRGDAGAALLAPLVARLATGRSTADLRRASALLEQCAPRQRAAGPVFDGARACTVTA